jgi:hypothetical protein
MSFKKSSWVLVVSLLTNFIFSGQHASAYLENKPIFYMWAKPGCYSATLKSSPTIPLQSLKKLYPVSCLSPHHFEVFYAGQFKTKDGRIGAGGKEVVSACLAKSKEFAFNQRNSSSYNWSQDEEDLIGNWMADMGVEAQRFPNRNICYVSVTTKSWLYIKELNLPRIRGFEKYDN